MNNKKLGTAFENRVCELLSEKGFWVHFINPNHSGAQPFDIIAVKNCFAYAVECKTLSTKQKYFSIDRLEENQKLAFMKWRECGNKGEMIAIEYGDDVVFILYDELKKNKKVNVRDLIERS